MSEVGFIRFVRIKKSSYFYMRQKISELETTIYNQGNEIKELKQEMILMREKEQYHKFVIAIQDVNHLEQIESKLSGNDKKNLIRLKKSRVSECHYIDEDDDDNDKNDRRTVLYERIQTMSQHVRQKFDKMFPNLLDALMIHIVQTKTQPSDESLKDILEWWE